MNNTIIEAISTHTLVFAKGRAPTGHQPNVVRVFRSSPYCTELQIRAEGTTNENRGGVTRQTFSHARLNAAQIDELIAALETARAELTARGEA